MGKTDQHLIMQSLRQPGKVRIPKYFPRPHVPRLYPLKFLMYMLWLTSLEDTVTQLVTNHLMLPHS